MGRTTAAAASLESVMAPKHRWHGRRRPHERSPLVRTKAPDYNMWKLPDLRSYFTQLQTAFTDPPIRSIYANSARL